MTNQTKQAEMFKAQAAAGLALREGIEAMVSLLDESKVKQEMLAMLEAHRTACAMARPLNIPACTNRIDMNQH